MLDNSYAHCLSTGFLPAIFVPFIFIGEGSVGLEKSRRKFGPSCKYAAACYKAADSCIGTEAMSKVP